ncbi:YkgB family protein [Streptomyces sp. NPDC057746]|uniref:YkgB family protein n=1 Tax=unclassified Streptomyces TaxID=2593676 RepID=UPI0036C5E9D6
MTRRPTSGGLYSGGMIASRYGLALNLLSIGRLKFESYEVENIRPLIVSSPLMRQPLKMLGEKKLARVIGLTEIAIGGMVSTGRWAPRVSATGSLLAAGMFAVTLSFLITTPEAWQVRERGREPQLSLAGQFLIKDVVLLGASLVTAAESLKAS